MVRVRILARQPLACSSAEERPRDMGEVDRFDPVQANREFVVWLRSSSRIEHLASTQEAAGSIPVGASLRVHSSAGQSTGLRCRRLEVRLLVGALNTYGGIAQRREQPSHKRHVVCSTHTPVTNRKEVVVYWPTAVRACKLCDVLG